MQTANSSASKQKLSPRLLELQKKIQDENYINAAIDRIAVIISKQIAGSDIEKKF